MFLSLQQSNLLIFQLGDNTRMSVYIKIKNAVLNERPTSPVYLLIESASAILKTLETPSSKKPFWESSFICSIRERYLHFRICQNSQNANQIPSGSLLEELRQNRTIALGELPFQYFEQEPGKQSLMRLELVSGNGKNKFKKQGYLDLVVCFQPNKNYVGEMEFYEFGEMLGTKTQDLKGRQVDSFQGLKQNVGSNFSNGSNPDSLKPLYKGPCKTKNLFSCCDQPVRENEYEIIEPHYFP